MIKSEYDQAKSLEKIIIANRKKIAAQFRECKTLFGLTNT